MTNTLEEIINDLIEKSKKEPFASLMEGYTNTTLAHAKKMSAQSNNKIALEYLLSGLKEGLRTALVEERLPRDETLLRIIEILGEAKHRKKVAEPAEEPVSV